MEQRKNYDRALAIQATVNRAAEYTKSLDESAVDLNQNFEGYVLADFDDLPKQAPYFNSAYCKYDPKNGNVSELEVVAYNPHGGLGSSSERHQISLATSSSGTVYETRDGTVAVDTQGNLIFEPANPVS